MAKRPVLLALAFPATSIAVDQSIVQYRGTRASRRSAGDWRKKHYVSSWSACR